MKIRSVEPNNRKRAFEVVLEGRTHDDLSVRTAPARTRVRCTSATQFYRLLDQTNYSKSIGQLLSLLEILNCEVEFVVRDKPAEPY